MSTAALSGAETAEFNRQLIDTTLGRMLGVIAALLLVLASAAFLNLRMDVTRVPIIQIADLLCLAMLLPLLLLLALGRRPDASARLRHGICITFLCALLLFGNIKFFAYASQGFGNLPSYVIPVVAASTVFLLPLRQFLCLLWGITGLHLLLASVLTPPDFSVSVTWRASLIATGVANVIFVTLYRARHSEFVHRLHLQRLNQELERRNQDMNEMMAIAAHDLRSPLFGLRNVLALAAARDNYDQQRLQDILGHAGRACDDLLERITRMLDAHECEHGTPPEWHTVDLRQWIQSALDRCRVQVEARGLRLQLQMPDQAIVARVDVDALDRAMDNLLSNACKFSPSGGLIQVRLGRGTGDNIDGNVTIEVIDEGPGIPEPQRQDLFSKFKRGSARTRSGEPCTGLGLFIAHSRLAAMGAHLSYAPAGDIGSTFCIRLQ